MGGRMHAVVTAEHPTRKPDMSFSKSILAKILVPVLLIIVFLVALTVTVSTSTFSRFAQESFTKEIQIIQQSIDSDLTTRRILAADQANGLAKNIDLIAAIKAVKESDTKEIEDENRKIIHDIIEKFESARKCDFFTILCPEGKVIYRSNRPTVAGDFLDLRSSRETLVNKKACVFFESTASIRLAIRAAAPAFDENGEFFAVVTGGFRLDTDDWVDEMKQWLNADCTIFLGDLRIATTLTDPENPEKRITDTKLDNPRILDTVLGKQETITDELPVLGVPMKVFYAPLFDANEKTMGMVFAGIPMERQRAIIQQNLWTNVSITAVGLVFFGFILFWIIRAIVIPIREVTKAAEDLADGRLKIDLVVRTQDETGTLATAVKKLADSLRGKTQVARAIAAGDLTIWVPLSSQYDTLGLSLIRMRYGLYDSTRDLKKLTVAVGEEASSLTHVNQSLVENTSRSAEQLKEISSAIGSLHTQTVQNAASARNAENLTRSARDGSNEGREKMGRMVQAMDAITKSSSEIKNIIRVIDDIAFQTNLLALNAAVEAARAGQHGKGFAVVAEEVRNLAARSAKAARETAGLIEESIQHVGLGSNVAHETSESLNGITDQVEQINKIVSAISEESDQQAKRLGEMTGVVGQVSVTADANMQSVTDVSRVIDSVYQTAQGLEEIVKHFRSNEEGKVGPPTGYVPTDDELWEETN